MKRRGSNLTTSSKRHDPALILLWVGQLFSAIGDHLFLIAITWYSVEKFGSGAGWVLGAGTVATLLFGLFGGVIADRWDRRKTLIFVDLIRGIVVIMLTILHWTEGIELWHLIMVVIVVDILGTIFNPTLTASLFVLCKNEKSLQSLNALMESTHRIARTIVPGLIGALLLMVSLEEFFIVDAFTFFLSALSVLLISKKRFHPKDTGYKTSFDSIQNTSIIYDLMTGIRLLNKNKRIIWAIFSFGGVNFAWSIIFMIGVPLFLNDMSMGVDSYGLIVGVYGVGNILSLFISRSLKIDIKFMYIGHIILCLGFCIIGLSNSIEFVMIGTVLAAIGSPIGDVIMLTIIQTEFPSKMIGKIYSIKGLIGGASLSLGALVAAPLYAVLPIKTVILLFSLIILLIGVLGLLSNKYLLNYQHFVTVK